MFNAKSKNDPKGEKGGLTFQTKRKAQRHADRMNNLRSKWPYLPWDTNVWKEQPEEWEVYFEADR